MKSYSETIEQARLVREVTSCTTTGDVAYGGTALEVADKSGTELFHVVIDTNGERHILFFASTGNYRISLELMERILAKARESVASVDDGA